VLRRENSQLRARVSELEKTNLGLVRRNCALMEKNEKLQTGQVQANRAGTDFDKFDLPIESTSTAQPEFLTGSEDAIALLHKIESAARETRAAVPDCVSETNEGTHKSPPQQQPTQREGLHSTAITTTTPRPIKTPSFFSRSFSAIKSRFGLSTSTPQPPTSPTPPTPTHVPSPNTMTEVLSLPPTPVGERSKAPPKKKKRPGPMFKLFLKGVEPGEMAQAEEWAKHAIPAFMNRNDFEAQRKRLQTPLLVQDLEHFPSSKPWESGYGDPLGELEDDDIVPVWAVYLAILAADEEPKRKKAKSNHEVSMGIDDSPSLDEMAAAAQNMQTPSKLHDSQGTSASHLDMHPRRSKEPSPMFGSSETHQQGNNLFRERRVQEAIAEVQTNDREVLQEATNKTIPNQALHKTGEVIASKHNPSQGSYGLDYDSDEEDSTMLSDNSELDGSTTPLWTQPPPQAPVPAHATLPGGAGAETPSESTSQQPVDEVERQRQKLMKHTPAKPSRLREAFVPSPSLLSEVGNNSILIAASPATPHVMDDMPDVEELELTAEDWAAVETLRTTDEWKAVDSIAWPDAQMTYESDEEDISPL
jgi:hypothetical protein